MIIDWTYSAFNQIGGYIGDQWNFSFTDPGGAPVVIAVVFARINMSPLGTGF